MFLLFRKQITKIVSKHKKSALTEYFFDSNKNPLSDTEKGQYFIKFNVEGLLRGAGNVTIDMVYYPDINSWNGRESMQYIVKDFRARR